MIRSCRNIFARENDVRVREAEVRSLRGDLLLATQPDELGDAERSYIDAIAVAQRQHARSLELRATTSLARLLQDQGRIEGAREQLAPVYSWFVEGLETADLKAAGALLTELG
jgi:predicted ATPase